MPLAIGRSYGLYFSLVRWKRSRLTRDAAKTTIPRCQDDPSPPGNYVAHVAVEAVKLCPAVLYQPGIFVTTTGGDHKC